MKDYANMPAELQRISHLFIKEGLNLLFFKCEHIFAGKNKNLDLLFKENKDYNKAARLLENEGYILYMDEGVERYKKMYVKFSKGVLSAVHLHREIAWHGVVALNKKAVFQRARDNLPSDEDFLLIHVAHAVFENFKVSDKQQEILEEYKAKAKDKTYIKKHLHKMRWRGVFHKALKELLKDKKMSPSLTLHAYIARIINQPKAPVILLAKGLRFILRRLSLRRKGFLISLIGVNGTGKTTMTNELLDKLKPLTNFMHGQKGYYFGWDPFLPLTRIMSRSKPKARDKKQDDAQKSKKEKEIIKQVSVFKSIYVFIEFLARYWCKIYPMLQKGKVVVTDRFYYDQYAQGFLHPMVSAFLMNLFPKPDRLYVLDAPIDVILMRDKNTNVHSSSVIRDKKRVAHEPAYLELQKKRYKEISKMFKGCIIPTNNKSKSEEIIKETWQSIVKK